MYQSTDDSNHNKNILESHHIITRGVLIKDKSNTIETSQTQVKTSTNC